MEILIEIDVFAVGESGAIEVAWSTEAGRWNGPQQLGSKQFNPGDRVAASAEFGQPDQTDVFAIDNDGGLQVSWAISGNWSGPTTIR